MNPPNTTSLTPTQTWCYEWSDVLSMSSFILPMCPYPGLRWLIELTTSRPMALCCFIRGRSSICIWGFLWIVCGFRWWLGIWGYVSSTRVRRCCCWIECYGLLLFLGGFVQGSTSTFSIVGLWIWNCSWRWCCRSQLRACWARWFLFWYWFLPNPQC